MIRMFPMGPVSAETFTASPIPDPQDNKISTRLSLKVDSSSLGHGVHCVEDQVGEHFSELRRTSENQGQVLTFVFHHDGDSGGLRLLEPAAGSKLNGVGHNRGKVDGCGIGFLVFKPGA